MNLANWVSLFRIIALPVIIYLIYQETTMASLWAVVLFVVAFISDVLDGYLARQGYKSTKIGSFLDPFADKVLVIGLFIVFVFRDYFWLLILLFFVLRDVIVTFFRWIGARDDVLIRSDKYNKYIIYAQYGIVFSLLLQNYFLMLEFVRGILAGNVLVVLFTIIFVLLAAVSIIHHGTVYSKGLRRRRRSGRKVRHEKMVIIANRKSRGYYDQYRRHLLKIFAKRRNVKISFFPRNRRDMFQGINKKINRAKHIIIAGGDGSFESALNSRPLRKKSLGFFPLGAGNAFYSYFYRGKRFEYLRSRFQFKEQELDVLEVEWDKGKRESLFMGIGVDADVMRLSMGRTQYGLWDYVKGSAKAAMRSKADYDFEFKIDGKRLSIDNCANLTLAKVPYYGFSMRSILGNVKPHDGFVYGSAVVNAHSIFLNKTLRVWALILAAFGIEKAPLFSLKGKRFEVYSAVPFPVQAGGEFLGFSHWIKVKVKRRQKVLMI